MHGSAHAHMVSTLEKARVHTCENLTPHRTSAHAILDDLASTSVLSIRFSQRGGRR